MRTALGEGEETSWGRRVFDGAVLSLLRRLALASRCAKRFDPSFHFSPSGKTLRWIEPPALFARVHPCG
jgi:hypothetical protein